MSFQETNKQQLNQCSSLHELSEFLSKDISCIVGRHGGRTFKRLDQQFKLNDVVDTFITLSKTTRTETIDKKIVENLKNKIIKLHQEGNDVLTQSSAWARFGTFWRRAGNIHFFFQRDSYLNKAKDTVINKIEVFLDNLVEAAKDKTLSKDFLEKFSKIESLELYKDFLQKFAKTPILENIQLLRRLPEPSAMKVSGKQAKTMILAEQFCKLSPTQRAQEMKEALLVKEKPTALSVDLEKWPFVLLYDIPNNERKPFLNSFRLDIEARVRNNHENIPFITQIHLSGKRDEALIRGLLPSSMEDRHINKILSSWDSKDTFVDVIFNDPSRIERSLHLLTRTMSSGESAKASPQEDISLLADTWKTYLTQNKMTQEVALLNEKLLKLPECSEEKDQPTRIKNFNNLMRSVLSENIFEKEQLNFKNYLLEEWLENNLDWKSSPDSVHQCREILAHLQSSCKKHPSALAQSILKKIEVYYKEILKAEQNINALTPPSIDTLKVTPGIQNCLHLSPHIINPLSQPSIEQFERAIIPAQTLPSFDFNNIEETKKCFSTWLDYINTLCEADQFDRAEMSAMQFLDRFKDQQFRKDCIQKIPPQDIPFLCEKLEAISSTIITAHFALERPCVPHTYIAALLRNFEFMQTLLKNDPAAGFQKSCFDVESLQIGLKDPYLDLGTAGPEIVETFHRLCSVPGQKEDFALAFTNFLLPEQSYRTQFSKNPPSSFLHTQQAYRLLCMAIVPTYTLSDSVDMSYDAIRDKPPSRETYLKDQEQVQKKLKNKKGPIKFIPSNKGNYCLLEPYGVRFYGPSGAVYVDKMYEATTSGSITGFFHQKKPIRLREMRKRIVEASVASSDSSSGESGGSGTSYQDLRFQGAHPTQQALQDEQVKDGLFGACSPDLCKRLELMQTAPGDRVRNTLLLFAENSHLLDDPDWERVFELNLFRFGNLYQKLCDDPSYVHELVAHLTLLKNQSLQGSPPLGVITHLLVRTTEMVREALKDEKLVKELSLLRDDCISKLHTRLSSWEEKSVDAKSGALSIATQKEYIYWLLSMSEMPSELLSLQQSIQFLRRYLLFTTFPRRNENEDARAVIVTQVNKLIPLLQKNPKMFPEVASLRLQISDPNAWKADSTGSIWKSNSQVLDIQTGELRLEEIQTMLLPMKVKEALSGYLSAEAKRCTYPVSVHQFQGKTYKQVQLTGIVNGQEREFKAYISSSEDPVIFMKMENGLWYQKQTTPFQETVSIPRELQRLICWTRETDHSIRFLDEQGSVEAQGTWSSETGHITSLNIGSSSLFSSMPQDLQAFERIDGKEGFMLLGHAGKPDSIVYTDLHTTYNWNATKNRWESDLHPGFFLSKRDVNTLLHPLSLEAESTARMFSSSFSDYHLLDSDDVTKSPKIILSGREYIPHLEGEDVRLRKHTFQRFAKDPIVTDPPMLFSFEIDPERGLCSKEPEAYLYLSYAYYAQGKYAQAALAMRQAFNRMEGITPRSEKIIEFFQKWPNQEPNAEALRTQLTLYVIEQHQAEQVPSSTAIAYEQDLESSLNVYMNYCNQEQAIDPQLRLTKKMHEKFQLLARRSFPWVNKQLSEKRQDVAVLADAFEKTAITPRMSDEEIKVAISTGINTKITEIQELAAKEGKEELSEEDEKRIADLQTLQSNLQTLFPTLKEDITLCFIDWMDIQFYAKHSLLGKVEFKNKIDEKEKRENLLNYCLDKEIEIRTLSLQEPRRKNISVPLILDETLAQPLFSEAQVYLEKTQVGANPELKKKIEKVVDELKVAFPKGSYEAEMAQEIIEDVEYYCASKGEPIKEGQKETVQEYAGLKENIDFESLQKGMLRKKETLEKELEKTQQQIMKCFELGEPSKNFLRRLKEQDPVVIDLFREGRWCWGQNDWTPLLDRGVITQETISVLQKLYLTYMQQSIELKQIQKIDIQINAIQNQALDPSAERQKLSSLLQAKRYFDVSSHPLAPAMLLLEDELGIILNKNQVQHFCDMILHKSSFKHEVWGGGKTTVLRHLITKFHANQGFASSLLTHAPLIQEHHEQLKEATASFYGQQAYRTDFSRNSPTDGTAIRREHLKLVKIVQERGRTDQTLNSLLSGRHAHTLNVLSIPEGSNEEALKAFDEIQAFGKLLQFRQERTVIGSDELDVLFTPDRQHNYATGAPIHLEKEMYDPAFDIMRLLGSPKYKKFEKYFFDTETLLHEMPELERQEFLSMLADDLINQYDVSGIDKKALKTFLLPISEKTPQAELEQRKAIYQQITTHKNTTHLQGLQAFLSTIIPISFYAESSEKMSQAELEQRNANRLLSLQVFLSTIIPTSFDAKLGVVFGRSGDGIHTKPYGESGKCSESSQHSSAHLMVWYTCLDFMKHGIKSDESKDTVIKTYVNRFIEKAEAQRKGTNLQIDETDSGKMFLKTFQRKLSTIQQSDYEHIAVSVNSTMEQKIHFIETANFECATLHSRRLEGNGKQIGHDVLEIWGSSGNAERVRTLPKKVQLHKELIRQKGTIGSIFYNMIKDYEEGDIVRPDPSKPFAQIVAERLKAGSALIDVSPFFAGDKPEDSVRKMAEHVHDIPIRYVSSRGEVVIRQVDGTILRDDGSISPDKVITLFSHADRRGRDLVLPKTSVHDMTVSYDTTLTDFSQGGMRARNWGNGQKIRCLIDQKVETALHAGDKNISCLTKLFATLITNETTKLQRLHTLSTGQEIKSVADAAVQKILRGTSDLDSLQKIKKILTDPQHNYLEQSAEINLAALCAPKLPVQAKKHFEDIVSNELAGLLKLKRRIEEVKVSPAVEELSKKAIAEAIDQLKDSKLIMDEKYLEHFVTEGDLGMVEEVEVEVQAEQHVQQEEHIEEQAEEQVEHEVQLEQALAFEKEEEQEVEVEKEVEEPRMKSRVTTYPMPLFDVVQFWNNGSSHSSKALGTAIYFAEQTVSHSGYGLWVNGITTHRQLLAPSVLLVYNPESKKVEALMGTIKDSDNVFESFIEGTVGKNTENHRLFDGAGVKPGLRAIHYKLNDQRPLKEALSIFGNDIDSAIEKVAQAKCYYAGGMVLSEEEKNKLHLSKEQKATLEKYLKNHFEPEERKIIDTL